MNVRTHELSLAGCFHREIPTATVEADELLTAVCRRTAMERTFLTYRDTDE